MNKVAFAVSILGIASLIFSNPAIAGCTEDLRALGVAITTGAGDGSGEVLRQALAAFDGARALCEMGDENGARAKIQEARALLGLPS